MTTPSLHYAAGWFLWRGRWEHRQLPADAGFDYHPGTKMWRTRNPFAARRLLEYADAECLAKIEHYAAEMAKEIAAKGDAA